MLDLVGGMNIFKTLASPFFLKSHLMQTQFVDAIEILKLAQFLILNIFLGIYAHQIQVKIAEIKVLYEADKRKHRGFIDNWRIYIRKHMGLPL